MNSEQWQRNVLLKNHTTFKIGGSAEYFYIAKTKQDLIKAIKEARKNGLSFFILGGGSKLLVSDRGYNGLVIKNKISLVRPIKIRADLVLLVGAGVKLKDLVKLSLKESLTGLEWAAGIPSATIGGAVRGNAGAFGTSITDIVNKIEVLDTEDFKIKIFDNKKCQFGYRNSIFKQNPNLIIFSAELKLKKAKRQEIEQKIKETLDYRQNHHPMNFASAGSIFINPKNYSVGFLIEQCGLKGTQIKDAQISPKHANFIVNLGNAKADNVIQLIKLAKNQVRKKFNINLKEEIQYLGF